MKFLIFIISFMLFSGNTYAENADCENVTSAVQEAACSSGLQETEAQLVIAEDEFSKSAPAELKSFYEEEQKSWLDYREKHCDFEGRFHPGTMGGSDRVVCLARMNKERILYLKETLELFQD